MGLAKCWEEGSRRRGVPERGVPTGDPSRSRLSCVSLAMRRMRLMPALEIASRSLATGLAGCCCCACKDDHKYGSQDSRRQD